MAGDDRADGIARGADVTEAGWRDGLDGDAALWGRATCRARDADMAVAARSAVGREGCMINFRDVGPLV